MTPRIEMLSGKKLIGKRMVMSLTKNRTADLWRSFMMVRKEIKHPRGIELYSLQVYPRNYFTTYNPDQEFEKWALTEVADFSSTPEGLETFNLPGGLYAVFLHQGPASDGPRTFRHIFGTWLPVAKYVLDDRPHFELLGNKYKNDDPESEEEIWIPVRLKD